VEDNIGKESGEPAEDTELAGSGSILAYSLTKNMSAVPYYGPLWFLHSVCGMYSLYSGPLVKSLDRF
jgi:hypothetical protein